MAAKSRLREMSAFLTSFWHSNGREKTFICLAEIRIRSLFLVRAPAVGPYRHRYCRPNRGVCSRGLSSSPEPYFRIKNRAF
ncbi:unnamed protein product [Medioppia subpectinata]|uniref:Uncharacterized protein n=1 Tax=Medioppia subpectinata TaxID=1979941 RepID=A0A7R9QNG0_9ACAR|nr:unnamed protein product [Medioppia subpectinata]CAG2123362.1 unnamed protein product [Medioppia subpectinata]